MRQNASQQTTDYRGVLAWNSFTDGAGNNRPSILIPFFLKEHAIPVRRTKMSEIMSVQQLDPQGYDIGAAGVFWGTPEPLQVSINGWIVTPRAGSKFVPPEYASENVSYADIVSAYIEGRLNINSKGSWQRKDPDYYISPYGQRYEKPIVSVWEPQYSSTPKKTPFNATLILEY